MWFYYESAFFRERHCRELQFSEMEIRQCNVSVIHIFKVAAYFLFLPLSSFHQYRVAQRESNLCHSKLRTALELMIGATKQQMNCKIYSVLEKDNVLQSKRMNFFSFSDTACFSSGIFGMNLQNKAISLSVLYGNGVLCVPRKRLNIQLPYYFRYSQWRCSDKKI